jgi:hypothetical protein
MFYIIFGVLIVAGATAASIYSLIVETEKKNYGGGCFSSLISIPGLVILLNLVWKGESQLTIILISLAIHAAVILWAIKYNKKS